MNGTVSVMKQTRHHATQQKSAFPFAALEATIYLLILKNDWLCL